LELNKKVKKGTEGRQPFPHPSRILDTPVPGSAPSGVPWPVSRRKPLVHFDSLLDIIAVRIVTFLSAGTMALTVAACSGFGSNPGEGDTISRDTFVRAYYELRLEGLRSLQIEISIEARDRVLEEVGVTEEELLSFIDLWGTDIEMMQGIWEEVDSLQREDRMADVEGEAEDEEENPSGTLNSGEEGSASGGGG